MNDQETITISDSGMRIAEKVSGKLLVDVGRDKLAQLLQRQQSHRSRDSRRHVPASRSRSR